eukprot:scaffold58122_cov67-Phaeocystis_antarctica.AAC.1
MPPNLGPGAEIASGRWTMTMLRRQFRQYRGNANASLLLKNSARRQPAKRGGPSLDEARLGRNAEYFRRAIPKTVFLFADGRNAGATPRSPHHRGSALAADVRPA